MATDKYINSLEKDKVWVLPDIYPWSGIHINPYQSGVIEGVVNKVSVYTGSNIGSAEITFPKKTFGQHVGCVMPIQIAVNTMDNVIFRGFLLEENGVLSESEDSVTVKALDYKWYFSKCTRIRGRWFTSTDEIPSPYGNPNTQGSGKLKYEMFRGPVISDGGESGYIQDIPCIFNEKGIPNCLNDTTAGNMAIFKYRRVFVDDGIQKIYKYDYKTEYWTWRSILAHIIYWWLDPYSGSMGNIRVSTAAYAALSQLDDTDSTPIDLNIDGKNPLEAIDFVVKQIPGRWVWWLEYSGRTVFINMKNLDDLTASGVGNNIKTVVIGTGDGEKIATSGGSGSGTGDSGTNVSSVQVTRNYEESVAYLILKGGKLKLTTTVELQPVWEQYTVGGVTGLPFTDDADFQAWKSWLNSKDTAKPTDAQKARWEKAYRYYCIPIEGEFLTQALQRVTYKSEISLNGRLKNLYSVIETDLKKMFAHNVRIPRTYDKPCHPEFSNPVVFAWDEYYDKSTMASATDANRKIVIFDGGYNFDSDTGLFIFDAIQCCRLYGASPASVTEDDGSETKHKMTSAEKVEGQPASIETVGTMFGSATLYPLISRRIFCTLSITLDLPYVVGDDIFGLQNFDSGNFSRYLDFDNNDLIIHANAFYPVRPNTAVSLDNSKLKAYTLAAADGNLPVVSITQAQCSTRLYPCDVMEDYQQFPNSNDVVLLNKLDNHKKSIQLFKENLSVNFGILDLSYGLGDVIIAIENSSVEDDLDSGYQYMRDYISQVDLTLDGNSQCYSTGIIASNDIEFSPKNFESKLQKIIATPSVLRGKYESNDFLPTSTSG